VKECVKIKNMKKFFLIFLFIPLTLFASTSKFEISGWLPYWKKEDSASSTLLHLDKLNSISPFSYTVKQNGDIFNPMKTDAEPWLSLFAEAKKKKVTIIPTILWGERDAMELVLNNKKKRSAHIASIMNELSINKWDGIDIDYEGKSAETRDGYSAFLKELKSALSKKKIKLICTVEARTPTDSRYESVTPMILAKIEYANDYKVIGKYCDEVRIMAYDQAGDDLKLSTKYANVSYKPVSDIDWVKKVMTLALEDIPASKISLGVATYGYKYEIVNDVATGKITYPRIGSMNYSYANELANNLHIKPTRNQAGEISYTYATTTVENGMQKIKNYLVWYSDSEAIKDKVTIAQLYKLTGISIFKLDGAYDPALWSILPQKK
jgi:spore germination protein YaaH